MDFFRSVFSAAEEPPVSAAEGGGGAAAAESSSGDGAAKPWGAFSGLIKTIVSKSEPLIETYRRDLEEFGSGLVKETEALREVILEIPTSIEAGASVAQESLETVGHALDEIGASVWRGTAEVIAQGKDALLSIEGEENPDLSSPDLGLASRPNRFEAKIQAIQADSRTFSENPDDLDDFGKWVEGFDLRDREDEIDLLLEENKFVQGNWSRLVPEVVDEDTFWSRYFYRVFKLKQAEDLRANLVKRAISGDEEEDLSWEVEDDDSDKIRDDERKDEDRDAGNINDSGAELKSREDSGAEEVAHDAKTIPEMKKTEELIDPEIKKVGEGNLESVESSKNSDVTVVSTQPSVPEEDDLGWDEIEDLGESDEKKIGGSSGSPERVDLRRRLTLAEDEENLSWDIEDDEPKRP
ncbi:uncharacterized protein LOC144715569 [Wolffia australiana]